MIKLFFICDDVTDEFNNHYKTRKRAEELDAKIEQTDTVIDEIVYELYRLTDEEIEIVEEAVGEYVFEEWAFQVPGLLGRK